MRILKISLIVVLFSNIYLFAQKTTDKTLDRSNKSFDLTMPKMDLSGYDILQQIEPSVSTLTLYNDQLMESAVDAEKYIVGPNDIFRWEFGVL